MLCKPRRSRTLRSVSENVGVIPMSILGKGWNTHSNIFNLIFGFSTGSFLLTTSLSLWRLQLRSQRRPTVWGVLCSQDGKLTRGKSRFN